MSVLNRFTTTALAILLFALMPLQAFAQACIAGEMQAFPASYSQDFGTGAGRSTDPNVLNHAFQPTGSLQDDFYAVGRSADFIGFYMQTDGNIDADGATDGRYLGINMRGKNETPPIWQGEFYRQNGIAGVPAGLPTGASVGGYQFSTAVAGTCDGCSDVPNFTLILEDGSNNTQLASTTSTASGIVNDAIWRTVTLEVVPAPASATSLNIALFNSQPAGADGNDIGFDNIELIPLVCVVPTVDFTKSSEIILSASGDPDTAEAGDVIRYTYTIVNSGTVTAYNVAVLEGAGFTGSGPAPMASVQSGGADLDSGNGTATDVAPGQTLVFTADYVIQQADINGGGVVDNQADLTMEDLQGTEFTDVSDDDALLAGDQITQANIPIAARDDAQEDAVIGATTVVAILDNDGSPTAQGAPAQATVDLIAPSGATGVTTDGDGDIVSFNVPGEGQWSYSDATGDLEFTPLASFLGDPTPIQYTVEGANGAESNPATVSVTYGEAPVATNDAVTSATVGPVTLDPLGNDNDDGALDPTSVVLTNPPSGATLSADGKTLTVPGEGVWSVDPASGEITFTPEAGVTGDPAPVSYTVDDTDGNTSNAATISIAYGDVPVAVDDVVASGAIGPVTTDPLVNDSDLDGALDPASVVLTGAGAPTGSTLAADGKTLIVPGEGIWSVGPATGEITFTPDVGVTANPTPVTYTVDDDDGNTSNPALVSITYGDAPIAVDDSVTSAAVGPVTLDPLANDTDADGGLDPASVVLTGAGAPSGSTLTPDGKTLIVPGEGVWTVNLATGEITFVPEVGFTGDPTPVAYTVDDTDGNTSDPATVAIVFGDVPVAEDDLVTSAVIEAVTVDPLANDSDDDGTLDPATVVLTGAGAPLGSTLAPGGKTLIVPGEGVWSVDPTTGEITFTPQVGVTNDPTPVAYVVDDNDGNTSNPAQVALAYGEGPVAVDDAVTSDVIEPVTIDPLANDADADGTLDPATVVLTGADAPDGSTLAPDGKMLTVPGEGVWTVDPATGAVTFTPQADYTGDPTPVAYTVSDNDGNISSPATIALVYNPPPVAVDDVVTSDLIAPVTLNPLANDSDADGTLDPTSVVLTPTGAPAGSTLALGGKTLLVPGEGVWIVNVATGEIIFTPEAGFTSDPTPAAYTVNDDAGNTSNEATVTVDYSEPPVASDDVIIAPVSGPVSVDPLDNDTGDTLDPLSVVLTGSGSLAGSSLSADGKTLTVPGEGVWTVDPTSGVVTFTVETGFSGTPVPAAYTVSDVMGNVSNQARISVSVAPPLDIIANDDGPITLDGGTGGTSSLSVLSNDTLGGDAITDPSLVLLSAVSLPSPTAGSIGVAADGTVSVAAGTTPGTYTLVYEICEADNPTNCATAEVEIVVVDNGGDLLTEIEEDLITILEEDLTNTLTTQSSQISSYSADALGRLQSRTPNTCLADLNARLVVENILFDTDRAVIKPESHAILDEIAEILISCSGSAFEIAGHTDSDASDAYNIDLSQRRAAAVRDALAQRGVNTTGFIARGYGEREPIASNATAAGKFQNRRVEFRALDGDGQLGPCGDSVSLVRDLSAQATGDSVTANGQFVRDEYDCATDSRDVFEGSLSYIDTETGQTQSAINLSYRREHYRGSESVFGYFVGMYGSQSDVTRLADGEIRGLGVNAGIYGAKRLQDTLFVDYYLGAAAGRHSFDLDFDRDIGAISASGDYTYLAGFAGAALSGEVTLGEATVRPRVGFDYVYTPGADVDVIAELGALSEAGGLELDAISGGRVFAELRSEQPIQEGQSTFSFNPRVSCYQSLGALDGVCGIGGSIGIESAAQQNGLIYAFEIDGEWGEDYSTGSLTMRVARDIGIGVVSGDADFGANGAVSLSASLEMQF